MSETKMNTYEGMFLFPQSATGDLSGAADHVKSLIGRADAEVISFAKWDERRLAYEIKGNKRGVYFLTYFKADPTKMPSVERACNLSEDLLRAMFTRAEHIPADVIAAADGQTKLADEIKLRATEQTTGASTATGTATIVKTADVQAAAAEAKAAEKAAAAEAAPVEEAPSEAPAEEAAPEAAETTEG